MVLLHGSVKSFLYIMAATVTSLLNWSLSHLVWRCFYHSLRCESETQQSHSPVPFRQFLCLLIISGFTHSTYLLCVCMSDYSDPSVPAVDSDVFANTIEQHCLNHSQHSFHKSTFFINSNCRTVFYSPFDVAVTVKTVQSLWQPQH